MRRGIGTFISVVLIAWSASEATAGDFTWDSSDDGNWNDDSKWSGTGIPGVGDNVTIDPPDGSVTVTLDTNYEVASLTYGASDTVTIATGSYTLTVAAPGSPTASANLVGYWRLDEASGTNTDDDTTTEEDGTLSGDTDWSTAQKATSFSSASLQFNKDAGNDGTVTIPRNAELEPTTDLSMTFWAKGNADQSGSAVLVFKRRADGGTGEAYPSYGITMHPTTTNYIAFYLGSPNPTWVNYAYSNAACISTAWNFIAATYTTGGGSPHLKIYKNAADVTSLQSDKTDAVDYGSASSLYLGKTAGYPYANFNGWLDDVRIYNTALSTAQINSIYNETQTSVSGTITVPASATTTISGKLALGSSNYTIDVGSSATLTVSAVASGSGNLVKTGAGTLKLTGANTYTGTTTVKDGYLYVGAAAPSGSNGALGNAATAVLVGDSTGTANAFLGIEGAYTVGRAITVQTGGNPSVFLGQADSSSGVFSGDITLNRAVCLEALDAGGTASFTGTISGGNTVTKTGPGTVVLSGANSYTGATTVANGTLTTHADAPSGSSGALGNASSAVLVGYTSGTTNATLQTDGAYTVARAITVQSGSSGTKTLGGTNTSGTATFSGNVTLNDHVTLTAASGGIVNFTGVLSGSKNITLTGGGTVQFNGSGNTYSGSTTIGAGTLKYGSANQIADTVAVTVSSGAVLDLNGNNDTIKSLTVNGGTVQTGAGTLTLAEGVAGDPTANANLVGYWRLDESSNSAAEDDSPLGTDEDGTTSGATAWSASVSTYVLFSNPGCIQFTGATGKVQIPTNAELTPAALSFTLWVKRNGNQGAQASILWKNRVADNTFPGFALTTYPSADTAYASTLRFYLGSAAAYDVCDTPSDCLPDATWVHLACVFKEDDANEMIIYKNGNTTPIATANKDTAIDYGTNEDVCLGDSGAVQFAFTGWVDDFRIYNTALTAAQVSAIYSETQAAQAAGGVTSTGTSAITGKLAMGSSARTFDVTSGTTTVSAVISESVSVGLTKTGDGTLKVSGANTYTGTTTVKAGTLVIGAPAPSGSAGALGNASSAVLLGDASSTYAALLTDGAYTVGRAITVQAAGTTMLVGGNSAHSSEFSGNITLNDHVTLTAASGGTVEFKTGAISGGNNVTKEGTGTVKLSGTNTYSGTTTINAGTLVMGAAVAASTNGPVGNAATAISVGAGSGSDPATLVTDGAYSIGRAVTVNTGSSGTKTLGGTNTSGTTTWTGDITLTDSATITAAGGGAADFKTGVISGAGSLTKIGDGSLTLSGTNTYTGTTTLNEGLLLLGANAPASANGALGNAASAVLVGNTSGTASAFLETVGAFTVGRAITVQAGNSGTMLLGGGTAHSSLYTGNITLNKDTTLYAVDAATVTFSTGAIGGAGAVLKDGGGTVKVSGTNTYTGTTTVKAGTLVVGAAAPSGGNGALGNASSAVLVGHTSGTDAATLVADGAYSVGRAVTVQSGSSGAKTIGGTNTSGTTTWTGNITLSDSATFTTGSGGTLDVKTGVVSGAGNLTVNAAGGTVKLSGTNTYTGSTTIAAGTVSLGADANESQAGTLGNASSAVVVGTGADEANLTLSGVYTVGRDITVGAGGGTRLLGNTTSAKGTYSGDITLNADVTLCGAQSYAGTYFGGVISGSGDVTIDCTGSAGSVTFANTNTYTGTTTVEEGVLWLVTNAPNDADGALGHAASAVLLGDASDTSGRGASIYTFGNRTIARNITVQAGTSGAVVIGNGGGTSAYTGNIVLNEDISIASSGAVTFSTGVISGAGGITKTAAGTATLSGTNTYAGATAVAGGILYVGGNVASETNGPLGNAASAVLVGNTSGTDPTASLLTNGAYTIGRDITVRSGNVATLTLGASAASSSEFTGNITLNKAVTLSAPNGGTATFKTGVISGAGAVTKSGAGTVKLSGTNTYTGTTTVSAGTLVVGANAPNDDPGALGDAASAVLLGDVSGTAGATLVMDDAYTVGRTMTVQSGSSGTKTLGGTNTSGTCTYSGAITCNADTTLTAASGGTVDFTGGLAATGDDLTKSGAGTVKANSAVSAATLTISAGRYWIPAAKTTTIDDTGTTTVASGAELYTVGASGSVATLTSGGTHGLSVSDGGTLWGRHFTYSNLKGGSEAAGITIANGARIAELSWGTLNKTAANGPVLDLSAVTGANRAKIPQSFQGITFSGGDGAENVKAGVDTPVVRFFGSNPAYGALWGETYEDDPGQIPGFAVGRVVWQSGGLRRMTSETASDASYDTIKDALDANTGSAARFRWYGNPVINEETDINDFTLPGASNHAIEGGIYMPVQPASGARYAFKDAGAGPRVILRNAVVARGGVQEMTCQNCTVFRSSSDDAALDVTGSDLTNTIVEDGSSGIEGSPTNGLTLATASGSTYFAGHGVLDYHLKSTAANAIDDGTDPGTFDLDFEEGTRDASFDIGADEYVAGVVAVHLLASDGNPAGNLGMVSRIHTIGARADAGPYGYMTAMGGNPGGSNSNYFYVVGYAAGAGNAPQIVAKHQLPGPAHNFMYYKVANNNIRVYVLVDKNADGYADSIYAIVDAGSAGDGALTEDSTFNDADGTGAGSEDVNLFGSGTGGRTKFISVWRPESSLWRIFVVKAPNGSGNEGTLYKINAQTTDSTDDDDQQYGEVIWNSGTERKYDWRSPITINGTENDAFVSVSNDAGGNLVVRKPMTGNSNPAPSVGFSGTAPGATENIGGQAYGYTGSTRYLMVAPAGRKMFSVEMQADADETRWTSPAMGDVGETLLGQPTKYINTQFVVCGLSDKVVRVVELGGSDASNGIASGVGADADTDWPMNCKGNVSTWILMNGATQMYWGTDEGACYGASFDPTYHATAETGDEAVLSGYPYFIPGQRVMWTFRVPTTSAAAAGIYFVTDQGVVLRLPHKS